MSGAVFGIPGFDSLLRPRPMRPDSPTARSADARDEVAEAHRFPQVIKYEISAAVPLITTLVHETSRCRSGTGPWASTPWRPLLTSPFIRLRVVLWMDVLFGLGFMALCVLLPSQGIVSSGEGSDLYIRHVDVCRSGLRRELGRAVNGAQRDRQPKDVYLDQYIPSVLCINTFWLQAVCKGSISPTIE